MDNPNYYVEELQKEIEYLRKRNSELMFEVGQLHAANDVLKEQLAKRGKIPGRKKHNPEWRTKYEQVRECLDNGMTPLEVMDHLEMCRATFYRYFKAYKEEKNKEPKE